MRKLSEHIVHLRTYRPSVPGMSSNSKLLDIIDFNYLERSAMDLEMGLLNKNGDLENLKARCVLLQERLDLSQKEIIRLEDLLEQQRNEQLLRDTSESEVKPPAEEPPEENVLDEIPQKPKLITTAQEEPEPVATAQEEPTEEVEVFCQKISKKKSRSKKKKGGEDAQRSGPEVPDPGHPQAD